MFPATTSLVGSFCQNVAKDKLPEKFLIMLVEAFERYRVMCGFFVNLCNDNNLIEKSVWFLVIYAVNIHELAK